MLMLEMAPLGLPHISCAFKVSVTGSASILLSCEFLLQLSLSVWEWDSIAGKGKKDQRDAVTPYVQIVNRCIFQKEKSRSTFHSAGQREIWCLHVEVQADVH